MEQSYWGGGGTKLFWGGDKKLCVIKGGLFLLWFQQLITQKYVILYIKSSFKSTFEEKIWAKWKLLIEYTY